jgi:medium-chain acyl-[acyl-carrier-protein] hydrolase
MVQGTASGWIAYANPNGSAKVRLFCFPYAGGGASAFRKWRTDGAMNLFINLCPVQLPGRENRIRERPRTSVQEVAREAAHALLPLCDVPFAFFGHSLGAVVAYEVAQHLRTAGVSQPRILFVSARRAPQIGRSASATWNLPDEEFTDRLRALEGTPTGVLEDRELMQLLLPLLRADFQCDETYRHPKEYEPLDCPIIAFAGVEDRETSNADLCAWREVTRGEFRVQKLFEGGHFYLHDHAHELYREIASTMGAHLAA